MDISDNMGMIAYYEESEIYIYDLKANKKKHVANQFLFHQYILDLKLSSNGRYIFYTVGDITFFWDGWYRTKFFIVDTETGSKVRLTKLEKALRYYQGFQIQH